MMMIFEMILYLSKNNESQKKVHIELRFTIILRQYTVKTDGLVVTEGGGEGEEVSTFVIFSV
jgi:hypothetical protein